MSAKASNVIRSGAKRFYSSPVRIAILSALLCLFFLAVADAASSVKASPVKPNVASGNLPLLLDIGADKCIPCIMMAPILEDLRKEYAGVLDVRFIDAWKDPEEAKKYRVRGIPTQIFYDTSGNERRRHFGFISKEDILEAFEELGVPLKKPVKK